VKGFSFSLENSCAGSYRYGFNGMEKDDEVKGVAGSSYTTEYRQYDSRLGRWLSIDPAFRNFSWQSPYAAFDNNPIYFKDPKGLAAEGGEESVKKGDAFKGSDGASYTSSSDEFVVDGTLGGGNKETLKQTSIDPNKVLSNAATTAGVIDNLFNTGSKILKGSSKAVKGLTGYTNTVSPKVGLGLSAITFAQTIKSTMADGKKISLGTVVGSIPHPVGLFGMVLDQNETRMLKDAKDTERYLATQGWGFMLFYQKNYATTVASSSETIGQTMLFIYSAADVHEFIVDVMPTAHAYKTPAEAEKALGFKPNFVYYGTFENLSMDKKGGTQFNPEGVLKLK
jgi:RHS repeat-associated protein